MSSDFNARIRQRIQQHLAQHDIDPESEYGRKVTEAYWLVALAEHERIRQRTEAGMLSRRPKA